LIRDNLENVFLFKIGPQNLLQLSLDQHSILPLWATAQNKLGTSIESLLNV
jgi:hypothetical protein